MRRRKRTGRERLPALLLAALLLLSACGGDLAATAMHLRRTEGSVSVVDEEAENVPLAEGLGLYSGYQVGTREESYAWIDLDEVKLTKMDEDSRVEIQKDGKNLEISVESGSIFFNVTEPLENDETMTIRTADLLVGIRGTCGWVDARRKQVGLLEGKVQCGTADGTAKADVSAGELAVLTESGEIEVTPLAEEDVPGFVVEEAGQTIERLELPSREPEPPPEEPEAPRDRDGDSYTRALFYSPEGELLSTRESVFDEEGRIVRSNGYVSGGGGSQPEFDGSVDFSYGEDGQLKEYQFYEPDGTPGVHAVYEDTEESRTLRYDNGTYEVTYYDAQGRKSRYECYWSDLGYVGYYQFSYNEEGLLARADIYRADGALDSYVLYEYD